MTLTDTRVVAFDCDGVMFDTADANKAYYNSLLAHFGRPPMTEDQVRYTHMHTVHQSLNLLFDGDAGMRASAEDFRKQMTYEPFLGQMVMEPHLRPLLSRLRGRYKTAVATNRTDTMDRVLEIHGLADSFDMVVSARDVARPKPHPDLLLRIVDHFGIRPKELVYIGDSEVDEQAAGAAGTRFVAYNNPLLSATWHVASLREIDRIL